MSESDLRADFSLLRLCCPPLWLHIDYDNLYWWVYYDHMLVIHAVQVKIDQLLCYDCLTTNHFSECLFLSKICINLVIFFFLISLFVGFFLFSFFFLKLFSWSISKNSLHSYTVFNDRDHISLLVHNHLWRISHMMKVFRVLWSR